MTLKIYLTAICVAALLTGCGGDSSSNADEKTEPPVIDPTPDPTFDITPDSFAFSNSLDVERGSFITSEIITLSGIDTAILVTAKNLEFSINGGPFTSEESTIESGYTLQVRILSSAEFSTSSDGSISVGDISATFTVTTLAEDITPDVFTFSPQLDVPKNTWIESEVVTITGVNNTLVTSSDGLEYSVDGAEYISEVGTIKGGQSLQVRILSGSEFNSTGTANIVVGDYPVEFSVTTLAGIPVITGLSLTNDSALEVGGVLQAEAECVFCDPDKTEFTWSINVDGEEKTIATGATYTVDVDHILKEITLEARAVNRFNTAGGLMLHTYGLDRVVKVFSNANAFSALKNNGSVVAWGRSTTGGISSEVQDQLASGVVSVYSNDYAFAAIKEDGSVVTWGFPGKGVSDETVSDQLSSGVVTIKSTSEAFAAIKEDGSVVTWGRDVSGGDSSDVSDELTSGVVDIYATLGGAFAAIKQDGSVVVWGSWNDGGLTRSATSHLTSGVEMIYATQSSFAALKEDGSVITWGSETKGGDSSAVNALISSGVDRIYSTESAFAALKEDGSVITWGELERGGDSSSVEAELSSGVRELFATQGAFSAIKTDGTFINWGSGKYGGGRYYGLDLTDVETVFSAEKSFAVIKTDGSAISWGEIESRDYSASSKLTSDVETLYSTDNAFAALKTDGSVITWGDSNQGGSSSKVKEQLSSGVIEIYSNSVAFAALKTDGSVVLWGDSFYGGSIDNPADLAPELVLLNESTPL